ncbi:MAG: Crp/Fnr family transcriptional regulator [Nitrospirae bacterium]|nr:Crp/Fnr family transcriptional regulator [Nitrospirota bacterium]
MERTFPSRLWYLKRIKLFSGLSEDEMKRMEQLTRMESVRRQQPVYFPGDPGDQVYLLKEGRVRISRITEDGHELTLEILEPGEIFGELEALENSLRDTMAVALDDISLCVIRKDDFESFLQRRSDLSIRLTKLTGLRLKKIENRIGNLLYRDIPSRLAGLLLDLAEEMGKEEGGSILIRTRFTHQELANLIASTRETVTLTLGEFRKKGLIDFDRKRIIIRDKPGLTAFL